jgi:hypothetical protein
MVVAAGVAFVGLGPASSAASSHREAPLIAADPAVDNTDLYAFVSPERAGYVTFIANWQPFEEPNGGPNFYPFATDAVYNVNVDSDGDAKADAVFRWTFQNIDSRGGNTFLYANGPVTSLDDENLLFRQTYTLESSFHGEPFKTRISGAPVAPSRVGKATMPDYAKLRADANKRLPGGWNTFAGQADDPFYADLRVFDLLYGGDLSEIGQDTLAGYNVNTIALQVPFSDVALKGDVKRNPVIGIWSTTERAKTRINGQPGAPVTGDKVQVSRLGNPLVNEVVVPAELKDAFNSISPDKDAGIPAVVARVTDPELPKLIEGIYKVPAPAAPRNDLAEIFLTGITTKANGPIKAACSSSARPSGRRCSGRHCWCRAPRTPTRWATSRSTSSKPWRSTPTASTRRRRSTWPSCPPCRSGPLWTSWASRPGRRGSARPWRARSRCGSTAPRCRGPSPDRPMCTPPAAPVCAPAAWSAR